MPVPLLIIGAGKCGTTALYRALVANHAIGEPQSEDLFQSKELDFFIEEGNWARGPAWYERSVGRGARLWCDASPSYTAAPYLAGAPQRAAAVAPDARLLYIVRDPVDRIVSHYLHRVAGHQDTRPFDQVVAGLPLEREDVEAGPARPFSADHFPQLRPRLRYPGYLARSMYMYQVSRWLEHFDRSRLLVLTQSQLAQDPGIMRTVGEFLGIPLNGGVDRSHVTRDKQRTNRWGSVLRDSAFGRQLRRSSLRGALRRVSGPLLYTSLPTVSVGSEQREDILSLLRDDAEAFERTFGVDVIRAAQSDSPPGPPSSSA